MFAGRTSQLERLTRGLDETTHGRTTAFALVGEPGIGKTRLATELSARAEKNGMLVLWGRAWEAGGAPALWPWRQLLPLESFEAAAGDAAAGEFAVSDREQARFAQFRSVLQVLEKTLDQGPLLCVLDDLHAADLASIELATFVLKTLRTRKLCLVCTWRDREAREPHLRDAIARLGREAEVLTLDRLSADESKTLIGDRGDAAAIYRATAGNPLFLVETLRALGPDLNVDQLPVGEGISAVVRQRAARLDARQRDLLGAASAIGREGELGLLDAAMELKPGELEPLFATGLLSRTGPKSFAFSHALVRDAIYLELEPELRERLHEKLATVLPAGEPRAHHALLAPALKPEQVTAYTLEAAALMRSRTAWEEAVQLLERALGVVKAPAARKKLELALGWALGDVGLQDAMRKCFRSVADQARTGRDAELFARAVLGIGSHYLFGNPQTELIALIDEAISMLGAANLSLRARLGARKAAAMTPERHSGPALELARAAVREVGATADQRAQLEVAVAAGSAMGEFAPADQRVPINVDLVRLARELGEPVLELRGVSRLFTDHLELGELSRADAHLLERAKLVQSLQLSRFDVPTPLFRSMRAMAAGDWAVCDAAIAEVRGRADERQLALHQFWLGLLRDDRDAVAAVLPEALRTTVSIPGFTTMISAAAHAQRGDVMATRAELAKVEPGLDWLHATMPLHTIAHAALVAGSQAHLRTAYELLLPRAHLHAVVGLIGLVFGPPIAMTLGAIAAALGDEGKAKLHFEQAHAKARSGPHAAWVAFHHGTALEAPEQLARARVLAAELNMPGLASRLAVPESDELTIEAQGSDWRVRRGARQVTVPSMKGMPMLAQLVASPNREIAALELIGCDSDGVVDTGDAGELLDETAKAEYRARIRELTEELEEAEELGHAERAEAVHEELEVLRKELSRAVDVHGKDRRAATSAERARIAARRRLRDAIARISQADHELGARLDQAVRTGAYCCYAPNRRK